MTMDQIANVAEIVGTIIVVITVIYLTIQIRQTNQALRSNTAQATHDSLALGYVTLATDGDLNRLFRKGCSDPSELAEDEFGQYIAFWTYTMYATQNWLYQRTTQALDEKLTESWLSSVSATIQTPGFRHFWKLRSYQFSDELQTHVEEVLSQPPIRAGYSPLGESLE